MDTATDLSMFDGVDTVDSNYDTDPAPDISWNHELLAEVIKEYTPRLRIYLSRNLRIYEDVDDLMQELYIRVMMYPDPSNINSIKAFIFTIATNLLRDKSRRSCTRVSMHSVSLDDVDIPVESADPTRILEDRNALKHMEHAIDELQPNCKKAFVESRFEEKSYKEIAFGLGVSVSMVEKHIIEALKQIRHSVYAC